MSRPSSTSPSKARPYSTPFGGGRPQQTRPLPASIARTLDLLPSVSKRRATSASPGTGPLVQRSAVVAFETTLLQSIKSTDTTGLSVQHSNTCFEVLDELIPKTGVFSRVLKLIRDELYDVAHSDEYTASRHASPARVPYFVLVNKLRTARNTEADDANADRDFYHSKMMEMEVELNESYRIIEQLEDETMDIKTSIISLENEARSTRAKNSAILAQKAEEIRQIEAVVKSKAKEIEATDQKFQSATNVLTRIGRHHTSYNRIQDAFDKPYESKRGGKHTHYTISQRAQAAAHKLRVRFSNAQQQVISAFEQNLAGRDCGDVDAASSAWSSLEKRYTQSLDVFSTAASLFLSQATSVDERIIELRERDVKVYEVEDQFNADALLDLNRFYTAMFVSTNGCTFHNFNGVGTKYLRIVNMSVINHTDTIALPPHVSHVKFTHPPHERDNTQAQPQTRTQTQAQTRTHTITQTQAQTQTQTQAQSQTQAHTQTQPQRAGVSDLTSTSTSSPTTSTSTTPATSTPSTTKTSSSSTTYSTITFPNIQNMLKESPCEPLSLARTLSHATVQGLVNQFLDTLLDRIKETSTQDDPKQPELVSKLWFQFLHQRYLDKPVCDRIAHDVISFLLSCEDDLLGSLFLNVLEGKLSVAAALYYWEYNKLLHQLPWDDALQTVESILLEVYPFLTNEDDREELFLNIQSASGNKPSSMALEQYVLSMVLRSPLEPCMKHYVTKLKKIKVETRGSMTRQEFVAFVDTYVARGCQDMAGKVYAESELNTRMLLEMPQLRREFPHKSDSDLDRIVNKTLSLTFCAEAAAFVSFSTSMSDTSEATLDRINGLSEEVRLKNQAKRKRRRRGGGSIIEK